MKPTPAIESEKTLLGALLLESRLMGEIERMICPVDFYIQTHVEIFEAMLHIFRKRDSFDVAMICDHLNANEEDQHYIYSLANECCSTANVKAHADIIREKSVQRQLVICSGDAKKALKKRMTPHDILVMFLQEAAAEVEMTAITTEYLKSMMFEINKAFVNTIACIENPNEGQ